MIRAFLLLVLVAATTWLILRTNRAIDFREEYLVGPEAEKMVEYNGVMMRHADFIFHYAVQLDPLGSALVRQNASTQWMLLYSLYGVLGNFFYYLMDFLRNVRRKSSGSKLVARFMARALLAGLCGWACFLLVMAIDSPIGNLLGFEISMANAPNQSPAGYSVRDSLLVFPFAAGAFISTFYEKLEGILAAFLGMIEKKFSGTKT